MVGRGGLEPPTTWRQCGYSCQAGILTRLDDRPKAAVIAGCTEINAT